ncbi:unnamed protein product [Nyctereutes procyonoides]|uniref:(raccoon dog) hypothetical protein n=1 Tax=Nyctereutes procyonoides TaxID=34880 RepID=A0A811YLC7_NYCPR|nr:unnamed protein product [Nyctereutes procyonoides]
MEADTWRTRRGGSAPGGPAGLGTAPGPEVDGGGQGESRAGGCGEATRDPPSPRARSLRAVGDPLAEEKRSQRCLLRDSGRLKGCVRGRQVLGCTQVRGCGQVRGCRAGPGVQADLLLDAYFTLTPPE